MNEKGDAPGIVLFDASGKQRINLVAGMIQDSSIVCVITPA